MAPQPPKKAAPLGAAGQLSLLKECPSDRLRFTRARLKAAVVLKFTCKAEGSHKDFTSGRSKNAFAISTVT